jgi:hypothetical protein
LGELGTVFFLTVSACWAILVPAKFWSRSLDDSWTRRGLMLVLGAMVGLFALWLEGWTLSGKPGVPTDPTATSQPLAALSNNPDIAEGAAYLSYFALVFLALRWWKVTDRKRSQRFSFAPVLATAFWAVVLLLLWDSLKHGPVVLTMARTGAVALVMASTIVQLVTPWEQPPPPATRKLRLRYT